MMAERSCPKTMSEAQVYFLLFATIMNQAQEARQVLKNTRILLKKMRGDIFCGKNILDTSQSALEGYIKGVPALHRFPNKMAEYLFLSLATIREDFLGDVRRVFFLENILESEQKIIDNLLLFSGIGKHKAQVSYAVAYAYCFSSSDPQIVAKAKALCPQFADTLWEEVNYLVELEEQIC